MNQNKKPFCGGADCSKCPKQKSHTQLPKDNPDCIQYDFPNLRYETPKEAK